jgi:hypothetical protein
MARRFVGAIGLDQHKRKPEIRAREGPGISEKKWRENGEWEIMEKEAGQRSGKQRAGAGEGEIPRPRIVSFFTTGPLSIDLNPGQDRDHDCHSLRS